VFFRSGLTANTFTTKYKNHLYSFFNNLVKINLDTYDYEILYSTPARTYPLIIGDYIYGIPYTSKYFLKYNPETNDLKQFFVNSSSTSKYMNYIIVDDNIVCFPVHSSVTSILKFNLSTEELSLHGNFTGISDKFYNVFDYPLLYNDNIKNYGNKIYGIPYKYPNLVEYDVNTNEINQYFLSGTTDKYCTSQIYNNSLYILPGSAKPIVEFNLITKNTTYHTIIEDTQTNKFFTSFIYENCLYGIPWNYNYILKMNLDTKEINYYNHPNIKYYLAYHIDYENKKYIYYQIIHQ